MPAVRDIQSRLPPAHPSVWEGRGRGRDAIAASDGENQEWLREEGINCTVQTKKEKLLGKKIWENIKAILILNIHV